MSNCDHLCALRQAHYEVNERNRDSRKSARRSLGRNLDLPSAIRQAAETRLCITEDVPGLRTDYSTFSACLSGVREKFARSRPKTLAE